MRRSIDRGLANSRFGVVVLSSAFFAKNWTQYELDGLVANEMEGVKVILPICLGRQSGGQFGRLNYSRLKPPRPIRSRSAPSISHKRLFGRLFCGGQGSDVSLMLLVIGIFG